jgi:hypothetical protein
MTSLGERTRYTLVGMAAEPPLIPAIICSMLFIFCARSAVAGVLTVTDYSDYKLVDYIQGHRDRMVMIANSDKRDPLTILKDKTGFVEIYNLDKGTDTEIDYTRKSYKVTPYPPENPNPPPPDIYKRTGKRRKFLGYWCDEYRGVSKSAKFGTMIDYPCVSSGPPGAKEYIEYQKLYRSESVEAGDDAPGNEPEGFVLWERGVDDQGAAEGPNVTFIKQIDLPSSMFEPPAGFVKDKDP